MYGEKELNPLPGSLSLPAGASVVASPPPSVYTALHLEAPPRSAWKVLT